MIYVIGYPGNIGGASTELWHTLKLWRTAGLEVTLVNTWGKPPAGWRRRCDQIGCRTVVVNMPAEDKPHPSLFEQLAGVDGLAGSTVVSFCNMFFLTAADLFRRLDCRIVWVNCMNWLFGHERRIYAVHGPFDAYVCQSQFQLGTLSPQLAKHGVAAEQIHHIPGAFDPSEIPFAPRTHAAGEPFVFGRLSRRATDKFSTETWPIYERIPYPDKRARILGWDPVLARVLGQPPEWVETLPEDKEPAERFLKSLHAMVQLSGTAVENWPRTGLEAMAAGVPIVVEHRGGWPEMIRHGDTGFCCKTPEEIAYRVARLAWDEEYRLDMATRARRHLLQLCDPKTLWAKWQRLFQSVEEPA